MSEKWLRIPEPWIQAAYLIFATAFLVVVSDQLLLYIIKKSQKKNRGIQRAVQFVAGFSHLSERLAFDH